MPQQPVPITLPTAGRGHRLLAVATADATGIRVRLDSHDDLTFWAEFHLSYDVLTRLLASAPPSPAQVAAVSAEVEAIARGEFLEDVNED
jgi:hypothetical protein